MSWSSVALAVQGTVRLKNGGFVEGDVFEELPGERVSVRTVDGAVRSIPWAEVDRVDHAAAPAPAPTPAPTPVEPAALTPYDAGTGAPAPPPPEEGWAPASAQTAPTHGAAADDRYNDVTLTLFGALGPLGHVSVDIDATLSMNGVTQVESGSDDDDLDLAYGGGAQVDVPLLRFFSLAGQLRLTSWAPKSAESDRRALFVDVLTAPRLRFPFPLGGNSFGVAYVQAPMGLGYVHRPGDAEGSVSAAIVVGMSTGFMALLSEHIGLALELGWLHHRFRIDLDETIATGSGDIQIESELHWVVNQALLQLGLVIDF
jgi:hypothetical protein